MKRCLVAVLSVCIVSFLSVSVHGSGFYNSEHGNKAIGMGGAFVSVADDPTAVYYNPAGIVQLDGVQTAAGVSVFSLSGDFKSDSGNNASLESTVEVIPNAYLTYKMNEKWSLGLGTFTDFGLVTDWEDDWEGRFIIGGTYAETKTHTINPVVAYGINDRISISAGVYAKYIEVELRNRIPNLLGGLGIGPSPVDVPESESTLDGDDWSYGFNLGFLAKIADHWQVGLAYRSQVDYTICGQFAVADPGVNGYSSTNSTADLSLPAYANVGVSWSNEKWTFAGEMLWTQWSTYDKLEAKFETSQGVPGINEVDGISSNKDWNDTFSWRLGFQYGINANWQVRGGIIYDPSPIPDETVDPMVPSGGRIDYSIGLGYSKGPLTIDASYLLVTDEGRTFNNEVGDLTAIGQGQVTGEFENFYVHVIGATLTYRF